jgi:ketosteroid isomerase-like protein
VTNCWPLFDLADRRGLDVMQTTMRDHIRLIGQAMDEGFDFTSFKIALEARDAAKWARFYADDAEWIEYRHHSPPRAPNIIRGKEVISAFIERVCSQPLSFQIEDEIVGKGRAAFRLIVGLAEGRRIIEHIMIYFANGEITREVDVEAWD